MTLQVGLGLAHLGACHVAFGRQGGHPFFRDKAWLAQRLCTVEVQLGTPKRGLVGRHLCLAGGDQARLLRQAAVGLQALGLAGGQGGAGALHGKLEVVAFQAHQQVALGHMLVVLDQHLLDARAQLAGNPGDLALHVGVVGALVEAPLEVPVGQKAQADEQNQGQENQQATLELGRHGYDRSKNVSKFNKVCLGKHKRRSCPLLEPGGPVLLTSSLCFTSCSRLS